MIKQNICLLYIWCDAKASTNFPTGVVKLHLFKYCHAVWKLFCPTYPDLPPFLTFLSGAFLTICI